MRYAATAARCDRLADAVAHGNRRQSFPAILPLADAQFLERRAKRILKPRRILRQRPSDVRAARQG